MVNGDSPFAGRLGGFARGERHQPVFVFRLEGLQVFEQPVHVVTTFGGNLITNPPDFFKDFVFHTVQGIISS